MKSCPACKRTYSDDTIAFCLEDGSILSNPYDPRVKGHVSNEAESDPEATLVLAHGPSAQKADVLPPTIPAVQFSEFEPQRGLKTDKTHSKRGLYVLAGVVLSALIVIMCGVLFLLWKGETEGPATSSPQRTSGTSSIDENTPAPVGGSAGSSVNQNDSAVEKTATAEVPSRTASPVVSEPVVTQNEKLERYEEVARKAKRALDAAENALQDREQTASAAKANLDRKNANLQAADRDLKRAQQLLDANILSQGEFNRTKARYSASQKQQASAQNLYAAAQASYGRAKERYDKAQRNFLNAQNAVREVKAEINN